MKIAPVKSYRDPRFPTRAILDMHPELLRRVPLRWEKNPLTLAALSAACLIVTARWAVAGEKSPAPEASKVAPIFQHGDGYGSYGCVVTNPPAFLSEEEARQVITDEFKRSGLTLTPDSLTLEGIATPITDTGAHGATTIRTRKRDLVLDGADETRKVAYEFVSEEDFMAWETKFRQSYSTVSRFPIIEAAVSLQKGLADAKPEQRIGVFYDPAVGWSDSIEALLIDDVPVVPVLTIGEWLGATVRVKGSAITLTRGTTTVTLTKNSARAKVNGKAVELPAPVKVHKKMAYAPAQFLAETLGATEGFAAVADHVTIRNPEHGEILHMPVIAKLTRGGKVKETFTLDRFDRALQRESVKTITHDQLRRQVKDFVTWLKAQGVA